jgi:hypothetical protein
MDRYLQTKTFKEKMIIVSLYKNHLKYIFIQRALITKHKTIIKKMFKRFREIISIK